MNAPAVTWGPRLVRDAIIERTRSLPLGGEILVRPGETVAPGTVVAHLNPEGYLHFVNVARELDVSYNLAAGCLVKREGDPVARGEVIAARPAALGLLLAECRSPADGLIEKVYPSGHLTIRSHPIPVEAFVGGRVAETAPGEKVVILTRGTLVQGVWGQGGEKHGPLVVLAEGSAGPPRGTQPGAVVMTPDPLEEGLVRQCVEAQAAALIAPSAHYRDMPTDAPLAFVLTEGFGEVPMNASVREALAALAGHEASVAGVMHLRAGVERPEIIVPYGEPPLARPPLEALRLGRRTQLYVRAARRPSELGPGTPVRCLRAPNEGRGGTVAKLPSAPQRTAAGTLLPVAVVLLDGGSETLVPLCNLEVLELVEVEEKPGEGEEKPEGGLGR